MFIACHYTTSIHIHYTTPQNIFQDKIIHIRRGKRPISLLKREKVSAPPTDEVFPSRKLTFLCRLLSSVQTQRNRHVRRIAFLRANHRFSSKMLASCLLRRQNNRPDCFDSQTNQLSLAPSWKASDCIRGGVGTGARMRAKRKTRGFTSRFSFWRPMLDSNQRPPD